MRRREGGSRCELPSLNLGPLRDRAWRRSGLGSQGRPAPCLNWGVFRTCTLSRPILREVEVLVRVGREEPRRGACV